MPALNHSQNQKISYTIQKDDNLYQLARRYQTTVPAIIALNQNINPYNLEAGSTIFISPGNLVNMQSISTAPSVCPNPAMQITLNNDMRKAWEQHVYWTRMLLISIAERLNDQDDVTKRLLQNPADIAMIFSRYYSTEVAKTISDLLTEHLQIGAALIMALRDHETAKADDLKRRWYINADKMADAFAGINPYYDRNDVQRMLFTHLDLTTQEVAARLAGNYSDDIAAFNKVEQEALSMADYFVSGIMRQFPQKFFDS